MIGDVVQNKAYLPEAADESIEEGLEGARVEGLRAPVDEARLGPDGDRAVVLCGALAGPAPD